MKITQRHSWQVTPKQAIEIQKTLATEVIKTGSVSAPRRVAGVDISVNRFSKTGSGAVVVLDYPSLQIAEVQVVKHAIAFPYVPGLLSFREIPLLLQAFEKLKTAPGLVLVDGQGIAHPRRVGLASHLGIILNIPTIGCAKSRLCGDHEVPGAKSGSFTSLTDNDEVIGAVVRTRTNVKPLYISVGHLIDLPDAIKWVLACCRGYRLPEPTRLAHQAAGGNLKPVVALK